MPTSVAEAGVLAAPGTRYRFAVIGTLWLTGFFLYLDRVNISLAAPHIIDELGLSATQMGLILSIYYWGYLFGQMAGGVAADRLKIRAWALWFYVIWCITTCITGLCRSVGQFAVVRVLFGISEGAVGNPVNKLINNWALPNERGLVYGAQAASCYLGLVVGMPIVGLLIEQFGWRAMFFVTGLVTSIGVLAFWWFVYDRPHDHPRMPQVEREAVEASLARDRVTFNAEAGSLKKLTFREGLVTAARNRSFWGICTAFFFAAGMYFTNLSWLPGYLAMERGFSGINSGYALVLPYASAGIGAVMCGRIGDRLGKRALVAIVCCLFTLPGIAGVLYFDQRAAVVAMLCVMLFFNAAAVATIGVLLFDLLPAEIIGVANGILIGVFGGLGGIVGPLMLGRSFDLTHSFMTGFVLMGAGLLIAILVLCFVHKDEASLRRRKASFIRL